MQRILMSHFILGLQFCFLKAKEKSTMNDLGLTFTADDSLTMNHFDAGSELLRMYNSLTC